MAAEAKSNVTLSVDYTGRDYYSIREQLIKRVQDRVPDWQGNDPSDFGLALVESFAYMGDLVNYYIDRIANESYILTATQRENLINLAALFGYKPASYVSASTSLTLSSTDGYSGVIGGAILEDWGSAANTVTVTASVGTAEGATYTVASNIFEVGQVVTISGLATNVSLNLVNKVITEVTSYSFTVESSLVVDSKSESGTALAQGNYAKVIVPNDHPWTADPEPISGKFNKIRVTGVASNTSEVSIGNTRITYPTSAFNGDFPVAHVGYENIGQNVVWYRPSSKVAGISFTAAATGMTATAALGIVTYTAPNAFVPGQIVDITGTTGGALDIAGAEVASATDSQFTVVNSSVTGTSTTGTATVAGFTITLSETDRTLSPEVGQKIALQGVTVASGFNYNGFWVVGAVTPATSSEGPKVMVATKDEATAKAVTAPAVTYARQTGTSPNYILSYSLWSDDAYGQPFTVGQTVTVTGADVAGYNVTEKTVVLTKSIESAISRVSYTGAGPYTVKYYTNKLFADGDIVTTRKIYDSTNTGATIDSSYNWTNKIVSGATDTSVNITDVVINSANLRITYTTSVAHGFKQGDFITITGVLNNGTVGNVDGRTDVLNLKSAKILFISGGDGETTQNSFTVEGYWDTTYDSGGVAHLYSFTLADVTATLPGSTDSYVSADAAALTRYFTINNGSTNVATAWTTDASPFAKATPVIGTGTPTPGVTFAEVVYAKIPTVYMVGATALVIGDTLVNKGSEVKTQVTVDGKTVDVIFSTESDVYVPFRGVQEVLATHGEDISFRTENLADTTSNPYDIPGEHLGFSTGEAIQTFSLKEIQVSPRTVQVWVDLGSRWEEWFQVEHVQDYASSSNVFQVDVLASEEVLVTFGDGVSGQIPPNSAAIKATYIAGGGTSGNVSAGALSTWKSIRGTNADTVRSVISVTNTYAATGGTDPESNDSIRYNAPKSLRSLNRAVTLEDFAGLALSVDGIVKANAYAESRSSVTVYIAPTGSTGETTPGQDDQAGTTYQMEKYKLLVASYLEDKKQIGTTVTVLSPVYTNVYVKVNYSALPQYNVGAVETAIKLSILDTFSYDNLNFQDTITPEEVEFKLRQVDGVSNIKVVELYRGSVSGDGSGRNSLIGDPEEIFVFTSDGIELVATSTASTAGVATFVAKNAGNETLTTLVTPAFNPQVKSYVLGITGTPVKLTTTVNLVDGGGKATVSINDHMATYAGGIDGNYTYELATTPGVVNLSVTAEDGITTTSYKFKVVIT